MLWLIVAVHAVAGSVALMSARRLRRWALAVAAVAPASAVTWAAVAGRGVSDGSPVTSRFSWVPSLNLEAILRADGFSLLMLLVVSVVGLLVLAYSATYFTDGVAAARTAGLLTLFAGAMLTVVLADHVLVLFVGWELTSITSFFLIGTNHAEAKARKAATHALMVTGAGGLALLGGLVLLAHQAGTYRLSELTGPGAPVAGRGVSTVTAVALGLVLVGAFTKSAQYPFHSWLPDAMAAPTPISAYLHSATMVKAGVYVIARLSPTFAAVAWWRPAVVTVGLVTMVVGGLRALRPTDLKRLLAFGTLSQLGLMVVLFGIGKPATTAAGVAVLVGHALFKSALFLVVGIVDKQAGTRDVGRMPTFGPGWGAVKAVAVVSAASMAAVPLLAGFVAKESAYVALLEGTTGDRWVLAGVVVGSVLTVAYSLRIVVGLLRPDVMAPVSERDRSPRGPRWTFAAPAVVLASASVVFGVVPAAWRWMVDAAGVSLDPAAHAHLLLWPGLTWALGLSMATLGVGVVLFLLRRPVELAAQRVAPGSTGTDVYDGVIDGVLALARRCTSVTQSGSLAVYAGVVLATTGVAMAVAVTGGDWWSGWPELGAQPASLAVATVIAVGAVAATLARRRFAAAILLGVVGYGMALLFVLRGAPDLALTQVAVETLFVVVFLVVLRRMPARFERRTTAPGRAVRLAVSTGVAVFVLLGVIAFGGARTERPVSDVMVEKAQPQGFGRNVVNVILVDIRGLDTVGETAVLATAAVGIVALARAGRRGRSDA